MITKAYPQLTEGMSISSVQTTDLGEETDVAGDNIADMSEYLSIKRL